MSCFVSSGDLAGTKPLVSPAERRDRITAVIAALGEGEVVSYGDIADVAGFPGRARLVGQLLADSQLGLPWWRVVTAAGRLVPGLEHKQGALLVAEGVCLRGTRVIAAPAGRFVSSRALGRGDRRAQPQRPF